jgi:putative ABC transport system permease protein
MTIAMFSLIIFSLTTFSAVNANFQQILAGDPAKSDWDVIATANRNSGLDDLPAALADAGSDAARDISVAGRVTVFTGSQEIRQREGDNWEPYPVIAGDDAFFGVPNGHLEARARGYDSDQQVLDAVRTNGAFGLIDWPATSSDAYDDYDWRADVDIEDTRFDAFPVEVRNPATGAVIKVMVIGVLPTRLDWGTVAGIYVNEGAYRTVFGAPDYQRTYIQLEDGVGATQAARAIESTLAVSGVQADSIKKLIDETAAQDQAFTRVFQAFMALGLFVGIAALGVIAFRSVVERRQQIGMLRAIGYQSGTVALTFVLESSFVALMGILSGVVGGVIVSHNLFTTGQFAEEALTFTIPWVEIIGFAVVAFAVSMVMTWWPSRSAAGVPVAEALRYE